MIVFYSCKFRFNLNIFTNYLIIYRHYLMDGGHSNRQTVTCIFELVIGFLCSNTGSVRDDPHWTSSGVSWPSSVIISRAIPAAVVVPASMGDSSDSDDDLALEIKPNPTLELLKKCTSAWQQFSAKRKMTHELKQYQEVFLTELPGSTKVTSAATHAVLEGELEEDESSKRVVPRFRDRNSGPSAGDKKKV